MSLRRRTWIGLAVVAAALAGVWLSAPGRPAGDRGREASIRRPAAVPDAYRGLRNPLTPTPEVLASGERLYMRYCSFCHGAAGRGDGPAGRGLQPRPTDLTGLEARRMDDAAFFWKVSDGVAGTGMPAWAGRLSPEERWQVLTFIRHSFQR